MDTTDWVALLSMLSSEKSLAYWHKLRLPVKRTDYEQTNRFARACLELFLFHYVKTKRGTPGVRLSWERYRESDGLLDENSLEKDSLERISDTQIKNTFNAVGDVIKTNKNEEIFEWAIKYFRSEPDPVVEVAKGAAFLFDNVNSREDETIEKPGLTDNSIRKIRSFCNHIKWRNDSLRTHFAIANNVYRMTLPDKWEMVLQDCFSEGARSSYWWMDSAEFSLQYVYFWDLWKQLEEDIKRVNTKILLDWLAKNESILSKRYYRFSRDDLNRLRG